MLDSSGSKIPTSSGSITTNAETSGSLSVQSTTPSALTFSKTSKNLANIAYKWTSAKSIEINAGESKVETISLSWSASSYYTFTTAAVIASGSSTIPSWVSYDASTSKLTMNPSASVTSRTYSFNINNAMTSPFSNSYSRTISVKVTGSSSSTGDTCIGLGIESTGGCVVTLIIIFGVALLAPILLMAGVAKWINKYKRKQTLREMEYEVRYNCPVADENEYFNC